MDGGGSASEVHRDVTMPLDPGLSKRCDRETAFGPRQQHNAVFSITSLGQPGIERHCDVPMDLVGNCPPSQYEDVRAWFGAEPARRWAAYVAGIFHVLSREHHVRSATVRQF